MGSTKAIHTHSPHNINRYQLYNQLLLMMLLIAASITCFYLLTYHLKQYNPTTRIVTPTIMATPTIIAIDIPESKTKHKC